MPSVYHRKALRHNAAGGVKQYITAFDLRWTGTRTTTWKFVNCRPHSLISGAQHGNFLRQCSTINTRNHLALPVTCLLLLHPAFPSPLSPVYFTHEFQRSFFRSRIRLRSISAALPTGIVSVPC